MTALDHELEQRRAARTAEMPVSLAEALARLQRALPEVKKSETAEVEMKSGGKFRYTYAGLASVTAQIMPALGELGLSFSCRPTLNERGQFVLAYQLLHVSGEHVDGEYPLSGTTPQQQGSAITYARRYSLLAVTGLAPDEDDDAAAAEAEAQTQRGSAQRKTWTQEHQRPPTSGTGKPATERPTAQRATRTTVPAGSPPLPGEVEPITKPQRDKVLVMFDKLGITERPERLDLSSLVVGRALTSANELTKAEARTLIDRLEQAGQQDDPTGWLYASVRSQPDSVTEPPDSFDEPSEDRP